MGKLSYEDTVKLCRAAQVPLVDREGIVLQLVAQLGLEIAQLFLEHIHAHDANVFGLQRSCGFDHHKELVRLACVVVRRLKR